MWDKLSGDKKMIAGTFIFLFVTFAAMGVFMENTVAVTQYGKDIRYLDSELPVAFTPTETASSSKGLKAIVKGSIYETGSNMTVYGACFDGDSYLLPEASAEFTAWYPNGSIMLGPNASMDMIYDDFDGYHVNGTGRWKIHVTMGNTVGTYLTEMRCMLDGEWAIALGEWQNPEWVERIANIDNITSAISTDLSVFSNQTAIDFTNVLSQIQNIDSQVDIQELGESIRAIDLSMWVLDETNPFFVLGSNSHNFKAIDMLSPDAVAAVSIDGYFAYWDGESWAEISNTDEYRGVSLLPANQIYAIIVGTDGSDPIISINGQNSTIPSLGGPLSPTALNDVVVFSDPDNPTLDFITYVLDDLGGVYYSTDSLGSWSYLGQLAAGDKGRLSDVVENYLGFAEPNGYMVLGGQAGYFFYHDGVTFTSTAVTGTVADVELLYGDYGYVVTNTGSGANIYKWNGSSLALEYSVEGGVTATGVEIITQNDVWVTTTDPSMFYHFNGRTWEYSTVGYSQAVSVIISFVEGANITTQGVQDVSLIDSRHGYAVGQDGMILVLESETQQKLDQLYSNLQILAANFSANISLDIGNLTADLTAINVSISNRFDYLDTFLNNMNQSITLQLTNIENNVTYTNLYLQSTLYPMIDQILVNLGIIEGKLNQTLEITNSTLQIVNQTAGDVDELVNRSRRIRAWVTQ